MGDSKLSNLIQITNKKIQFLNSHLENQETNQFYEVPPENPSEKHISRMVHDLDYLIARSDLDTEKLDGAYQEVRSKLLDLKEHLSDVENDSQSPER